MAKLNQILAIEKGIKSETYSAISTLHKAVQKPELFNGFDKEYKPIDEAGERLPAEKKRVQLTAKDVLRQVARLNSQLMQVTARKDFTNCVAKASVTVDGKVVIADAPVSYLLFLEKQLSDFHDVVKQLPVLDEADVWEKDENSGLHRTKAIETHRTKKVQKPMVLLAPTVEHPGNAVLVAEDVLAGYWSNTKQSGAMPKPAKEELLERVTKLQQAVKQAREAANIADEVAVPDIGTAVYGYLLED